MPIRVWLVTVISDRNDPLLATAAVTVSQAPSHFPPAIASAAYLSGLLEGEGERCVGKQGTQEDAGGGA